MPTGSMVDYTPSELFSPGGWIFIPSGEAGRSMGVVWCWCDINDGFDKSPSGGENSDSGSGVGQEGERVRLMTLLVPFKDTKKSDLSEVEGWFSAKLMCGLLGADFRDNADRQQKISETYFQADAQLALTSGPMPRIMKKIKP